MRTLFLSAFLVCLLGVASPSDLIHDTRLPMTEVALSAGFGSVRRFNEIFRKMFGRPPSALRRQVLRPQAPDSSVASVTRCTAPPTSSVASACPDSCIITTRSLSG